MAAADYRKCDVCGTKAFYDANLNYTDDRDEWTKETKNFRVCGEEQRWGNKLDRLGDWAVLCAECAKTHKTAIVPIASAS